MFLYNRYNKFVVALRIPHGSNLTRSALLFHYYSIPALLMYPMSESYKLSGDNNQYFYIPNIYFMNGYLFDNFLLTSILDCHLISMLIISVLVSPRFLVLSLERRYSSITLMCVKSAISRSLLSSWNIPMLFGIPFIAIKKNARIIGTLLLG